MTKQSYAHVAQDLKSAVADRESLSPCDLAAAALSSLRANKVSGNLSQSLLLELKRRFALLPREPNPDGSRRLIDGAPSFNKWLEIHEIPKRNIFYVLANKSRPSRRPYMTLTLTRDDAATLLSALPARSRLRKRVEEKIQRKDKKHNGNA